MTTPAAGLVPPDFMAPLELRHERFVLEPLGPQHNDSDLAAWSSSIEHIRATSGYPDGNWPPLGGMSAELNLADLQRHAEDFEAKTGFTFTVLEPGSGEVIGCVYLYPPEASTDVSGSSVSASGNSDGPDVVVQSWVTASHAELDAVLAEAVAEWLKSDWPWTNPDFCGRAY